LNSYVFSPQCPYFMPFSLLSKKNRHPPFPSVYLTGATTVVPARSLPQNNSVLFSPMLFPHSALQWSPVGLSPNFLVGFVFSRSEVPFFFLPPPDPPYSPPAIPLREKHPFSWTLGKEDHLVIDRETVFNPLLSCMVPWVKLCFRAILCALFVSAKLPEHPTPQNTEYLI